MSDAVTLRMVERRRRIAGAVGGVGDVTAPTLTLPLALPLGDTSGYLGVTTNEGNGTLYYVVTTSATPPSAAQVKAGQNDGGTAAVYAGSQAISSTGDKSALPTGLTSNTGNYGYFAHEDAAGNMSAVAATGLFTTLTTGTSDTSFDTLVAAAAVALSDLRKGYVARFIGALYAASVWTKIDVMWVLAAHDEQFGRLNWKSPGNFTLTAVNSPVFVTDRSYSGDGVSGLLDTGWDAATNAVQFTRDNAAVFFYSRTSTGGSGGFGTRGSGAFSITIRHDGVRLNGGSELTGGSGTLPYSSFGRRNVSTDISFGRDGVQAATGARASLALTTADLAFGGVATAFTSGQCSGGALSAYLDDTEILAVHNAWYAYMVALGADT